MNRLQVAIVADGDPRSVRTNSGVAAGLVAALDRRDDVEVVATIDSTPSRATALLLSATSVRLPLSSWRNQKRKGRAATAARSRVRDRALAQLESTPDVVVHVRNTYLPAELPYVVFIDGTASLSQRFWPAWSLPERDYRARIGLETSFFSSALLVATAGRYVVDEIVDYYGQDPQRVTAIGGGTNLELVTRDRDTDGAEVRFLFVGREFERKGGPELLRAFARVHAERPQTRLTVVGAPGADPGQPGVEWLGFVGDRQRMRDLYLESDVFCLLSHHEPYGLAVQEALASGLACLVSDRGALAEIAGDAALVVDPRSDAEVVDALIRLADDAALRASLSARAHARLAGLTWDDVASRLVAALRGRLRH